MKRLVRPMLGLLLLLPLAAPAATIDVADGLFGGSAGDGRCSLVEALVNANATSGSRELSSGDCVAGSVGLDTVRLAPNGVYVMETAYATSTDGEPAGLPAVTSAIVLEGRGAKLLRGTNDNNCMGFQFRHLHVAPAGSLTASGLELRWGCSGGDGGAILNRGSLHLSDALIVGNQAQGAGGGLFNADGAVATLIDVELVDNSSVASGGAIHNDGTLTLDSSTVDGNQVTSGAGGGIVSRGSTSIRQSLLTGNDSPGAGGGVNEDLSSNTAIDNSTLTQNTSSGSGGALHVSNATKLRSSTVSDNRAARGSGLYGAAVVQDSLFLRQQSGNNCSNMGAAAASTQADDGSCSGGTVFSSAGAVVGPLSVNGGVTRTVPLLDAAALVDSANAVTAEAVSLFDQRGGGYARTVGMAPDAGAFEAGAGDSDGDGVADDLESGVSGSGDGNGDSTADSSQAQVVSRPLHASEAYLTLDSGNAALSFTQVVVGPEPLDAPISFPHGQVGFTVTGLSAGQSISVDLLLPSSVAPQAIWAKDSSLSWQDVSGSGVQEGDRTRFTLALTEGSSIDQDADASTLTVFADRTVPAAPPAPVVQVSTAGQVTVRWQPPFNGGLPITGYVVQRAVDSPGFWDSAPGACALPSTGSNTTASCTYTESSGGTRYYRIAAINQRGTGNYGDASAAVVVARAPGQPPGIAVLPEADSYRVTWNAPVDDGGRPITGYQVQQLSSAGGGWVAAGGSCGASGVGSTPARSCRAPISDHSAQYTFSVAAISDKGTGVQGSSGSGSVPEVAGNPQAIAGDSQVALSWQAPTGSANAYVHDYRVQRSPNGNDTWTEAGGSCADAVVDAATSCVDDTVSNSTAYFFRVFAYNRNGASPASSVVSATPAAAAGSNALLSLALVDRALSPAFSAGTLGYAASVASDVTAVRVRASSADPAAAITVNGASLTNGAESADLPLASGDNTIQVVVNATTTYTITVTRASAAADASLASLSYQLPSAAAAVSLDVNQASHSISVGASDDSVDLQAAALSADASVSINGGTPGTGSAQQTVALERGLNIVHVTVDAEDSADVRGIELRLTRAYDSSLSALGLSSGSLVPAFAAGTTSYEVSVAHAVESMSVLATAAATDSVLSVDGVPAPSGYRSQTVALDVGDNVVPVQVTAPDGSTTTYNLTIHRAADTRLLGLGSSKATLDPAFDPEQLEYSMDLPSESTMAVLRALTNDPAASLTIDGVSASSGTEYLVPVDPGANPIAVVVTGSDAGTRTYTVNVTRGLASRAVTPSVQGSGGSISPATVQTVLDGSRAIFVLAPDSGNRVAAVTGTCGGGLSSNVFTTDPVTADCTVVASFELDSGVPGMPQNVTGTPGDGQIEASWQAPASDGGSAITGYVATATPSVGGVATCSTSGSTTCTLQGLVNGTAYTLSVVASNAEGSGASASAAAQITPVGPPSAPQNVVASLTGTTSVTVSWDLPASTGGSAIIGYTVISVPAGGSCSTSGSPPTRSCDISNLSEGQSYTFEVTASNASATGAAASSNSVFVGNVPAAPQNVVATAGDGEILVSWAAPANDGGSAITGYTATAVPEAGAAGGSLSCATTAATSCSIQGLLNGVAYTVTVTASNAQGTGPGASAAAAVTPVGAPSAPLNVSAALTAATTATISWNAPASNGGSIITGYAVTSVPASAGCSSSGASPARSCQISGLAEGETYVFTVTASNAAQTGPGASSSGLFVGAAVDIAVSIRRLDPVIALKGGGTVSYAVEVINNGGRLVDGIRLLVTPSTPNGGVAWTCQAPSPCTVDSGSGMVDTTFGLGVGQQATVNIVVTLAAEQNFVELAAQAIAPSGVVVARSEDDRAVILEPVGNGTFGNGFE